MAVSFNLENCAEVWADMENSSVYEHKTYSSDNSLYSFGGSYGVYRISCAISAADNAWTCLHYHQLPNRARLKELTDIIDDTNDDKWYNE